MKRFNPYKRRKVFFPIFLNNLFLVHVLLCHRKYTFFSEFEQNKGYFFARAKSLKTNCNKALEVLKQTKIQTIIF